MISSGSPLGLRAISSEPGWLEPARAWASRQAGSPSASSMACCFKVPLSSGNAPSKATWHGSMEGWGSPSCMEAKSCSVLSAMHCCSKAP
eukprot:CAMPEP_0115549158 /NCGR_PEP_ID=MMETSP0271-20121206/94541_1 /TAXON_ID=71861 /ORGANISM="Scrippsiella trochoidea, Strain CCMP3099" /LENGTH=89 /DNA_ID=CAMNT_0002982659 /DNA_START=67 /DNA_END=336 /DNA_ORIENTATION=+